MKTCSRCKKSKPLAEFHTCTSRPDGKQYWCKTCHQAVNKANGIRRRYGLTPEEYAAILANGCAICGAGGVVLDHCHASGKARGALCQRCNMGLGQFQDDPARLRAAALYIEGEN